MLHWLKRLKKNLKNLKSGWLSWFIETNASSVFFCLSFYFPSVDLPIQIQSQPHIRHFIKFVGGGGCSNAILNMESLFFTPLVLKLPCKFTMYHCRDEATLDRSESPLCLLLIIMTDYRFHSEEEGSRNKDNTELLILHKY